MPSSCFSHVTPRKRLRRGWGGVTCSPVQDVVQGLCNPRLLFSYKRWLENNLWSTNPFCPNKQLMICCQVKHGLQTQGLRDGLDHDDNFLSYSFLKPQFLLQPSTTLFNSLHLKSPPSTFAQAQSDISSHTVSAAGGALESSSGKAQRERPCIYPPWLSTSSHQGLRSSQLILLPPS